ncbi:MAG: AAA domain-containing protein [Bacteroidota bacterium]
MRQILHTYKLRLTNLSQGNRSLRLARLSKRRDIDLKDLGFIEKDSSEQMLSKIIGGKNLTLLSRLDPRHEGTNLVDRRLNYIYRTAETLLEESGSYDLFVGYPFIEGKFLDGTIARCPVLLFPVRLIRNLQLRPRWSLEIVDDEAVVFNKTFFLAYEQFHQVRLPAEFWEEEIEPNKDWREWLNSFYKTVKEYELEINVNPRLFDLTLEQLVDYRKETMDRFRVGELICRPQAVLGIFPQSDSALLKDYEQIEQQISEFGIETIFGKEVVEPDPGQDESPRYIKEEDRYFVTPVDHSQEAALLSIKQGNSLVVHGPPGTGKSQVIVNIIADALAHGKRVLVVSQKRAALDVVYKRLGAIGLNRFSVLVHDYRHDRAPIYRKIKRQIDDIEMFQREIRDLNITRWEHDYKLLSRQIDQLSRDFDALYEGLSKPLACGMTVHELYLHSAPQADRLPLAELTRKWDRAQLDAFLEKLRALWDYRECFENMYPWLSRLSFRHYGLEDRERLQQMIAAIPQQLKELHQTYSRLSKILSTRILDEQLNRKRMQAFRSVDANVNNHQIREGMEAIQHGKLGVAKVKDVLEDFEDALSHLDKRKFLDDGHWVLYDSLVRHVQAYKDHRKDVFRYVSLSYQRARWFLKRLLKAKELPLDENHFHQIQKDVKAFQRLHWIYAKHHDRSFFEDFSLFGPQSEKWQWLETKQHHLTAFHELKQITYFKKIKPRFTIEGFDMKRWQQSMHQIADLDKFMQRQETIRREWNTYLHQEQIQKIWGGIKTPQEYDAYLERLNQTFHQDFEDLIDLDKQLASFSPAERQSLAIIQPSLGAGMEEENLIELVRNSVYCTWIDFAEREYPVLAEVSGRAWNRKQATYREKLAERRKRVAELIQRRIKERLTGIIEYNRLKNPVTYRAIHHQVRKKRRLWSVRKLVKESWDKGLWQLVPCWMASPESAAAIFPMQKDFFDIVVFDEASQCFVERAIPVILRGKHAVIAGDDKQLQPMNLYQVRYEDAEAEFVEDEVALEVESILDLAKTSFEEWRLSWHYRSREEELINFSNHAFYEGQLQVIPPAIHHTAYLPPLEWIAVKGEWRNNRNRPEAERVIQLILDLIQWETPPSLGIVTFNYHQQELIKDLLDETLEQLATEQPGLYEALQRAMHKTEEEEFQGLFVKNIENVQGDERDIIIFSVGYGYNERGTLSTNFGLLNQRGGENRLNVAITRARHKSYIICSFLPGELKVDNATHDGPKAFRDYLRYAKAVSDGQGMDALHILNQQNETDISLEVSNPIADFLAMRLEAAGFFVERNYGDTSYQLDLAVRSSEAEETFLLGIECEGSHYFSGNSSKEREIYRPDLLLHRGWKLHRVWGRNFWLDREKEVEKILKLLS